MYDCRNADEHFRKRCPPGGELPKSGVSQFYSSAFMSTNSLSLVTAEAAVHLRRRGRRRRRRRSTVAATVEAVAATVEAAGSTTLSTAPPTVAAAVEAAGTHYKTRLLLMFLAGANVLVSSDGVRGLMLCAAGWGAWTACRPAGLRPPPDIDVRRWHTATRLVMFAALALLNLLATQDALRALLWFASLAALVAEAVGAAAVSVRVRRASGRAWLFAQPDRTRLFAQLLVVAHMVVPTYGMRHLAACGTAGLCATAVSDASTDSNGADADVRHAMTLIAVFALAAEWAAASAAAAAPAVGATYELRHVVGCGAVGLFATAVSDATAGSTAVSAVAARHLTALYFLAVAVLAVLNWFETCVTVRVVLLLCSVVLHGYSPLRRSR